jgi:hypothetical protein
MKKILFFLFTLLAYTHAVAQVIPDMDYYLPQDIEYNPQIPTPASVLGYKVGEWHVSHDHLVNYMRTLAAASDRISIEEYGRTHENRPLLLLTITSPQNHQNIAAIKESHKQLSDPAVAGRVATQNLPAVAWMGYSVHGNEPSGSNASLLVAYYLAAAQGAKVEEQLNNVVILFDPSINPDGLNRFASWVNTHKGKHLATDPADLEHNEAWPRGRTNHYWFDLNRDWLPLQHPESRGRIAKFQEWRPNVLTDHHEMGTNSTFFFQPGVPSRNHPLTPENTYTLTARIGEYHAKALDRIGSLYYTKEDYDDFFYGKGSTYPDINGGVGILFEQASSRGHAQDSETGVLRFPFTIRNQFTTSLSTLEATAALRQDLLAHKREFYQSALRDAAKDPVKAYVFGAPKDKARAYHLAEIIKQHKVDMYRPAKAITMGNKTYSPDDAYIVPLSQPQYRLIKAMFETRTSFTDSLFYDISAWTFPMAFNLDWDEMNARAFNASVTGARIDSLVFPQGRMVGEQSAYAYVFEWTGYYAPRALQKLFNHNLTVKVATDAFTDAQGQAFGYGSILVPVANQPLAAEAIYALMQEITRQDAIDVYAMGTGLNPQGVNLGSPALRTLTKPSVAMLVEGSISGYDAGEAWFLMDQRFDMPLTMLSVNSVNRARLDRYNTLLMVDGNYSELATFKEGLRAWVQRGGTIVAMGNASRWLAENGFTSVQFKKDTTGTNPLRPYASLGDDAGAQVIGGAIFETRLDLSHPIAYGFTRSNLPLFRSNKLFMERTRNPYASPVMYTAKPLMSGYISRQNVDKLGNTAAVAVSALGSGRIISMTDNPAFRAFWYGTDKLLMNSIFFSPIISAASAR